MQTRPAPGAAADTAQQCIPAHVPAHGLAEDLLFLDAWERGLVPWPGALLRVRQIRRANPALAAQLRAELARPLVRDGAAPLAKSAKRAPALPPTREDATAAGLGVGRHGR